jgi:cell division protein FtsW (lipid II flippase)
LQEPDAIKEYLRVVCEQIRWKKAHGVLLEEIENHILDQKDAFIHSGLDEKTATEKAIAEMGDPIIIGTELDRAHRPKIEWSIIILTAAALLINLAIRLIIVEDSADIFSILIKSISYAAVGIACMAVVYWLDFSFIGKYPMIIYLSITISAFFIGVITLPVNGQKPYINFILLLLPTVFAGIIYKMRMKGYLGIILSGAFIVLGLFIAMFSRNTTSIFLFLIICFILLTFAIIKGWFNVNKLASLVIVYTPTVIAVLTTLSNGYRRERLRAIINPFLYPEGYGYISTVTSNMISGAKFIGTGELGASYTSRLPSRETDYLLTYLIHRFGWISFTLIIAVLLAFITRAFILCLKQKSVLGRLIALSALATFAMQVLIYIAANLGILALPPLTLPLISYSGTATAVNMTLIGLMLSVFTSGNLLRDNLKTSKEKKFKFFEFVDGKIVIDLGLK